MHDEDAPPGGNRFAGWLQASMQNRGLTQAQLARTVGVADTQVSRWRRGQVVPTVQYLQRLADTFGIQRVTLDQLVGLPVAQATPEADAHVDAELQAHQARIREVMQRRLPPAMWRAYVDACVALAEGLGTSTARAVRDSLAGEANSVADNEPNDAAPPERPIGFRP
ncbi:MAG TPA: helix-turn-helix domain-containing protein [Chloroflexota bacterium]|jgi:transcriptional regulator with XRE-family HTH domain|nr:helix-turn-helix domain-containing protein [Chloroflexota bacterium]